MLNQVHLQRVLNLGTMRPPAHHTQDQTRWGPPSPLVWIRQNRPEMEVRIMKPMCHNQDKNGNSKEEGKPKQVAMVLSKTQREMAVMTVTMMRITIYQKEEDLNLHTKPYLKNEKRRRESSKDKHNRDKKKSRIREKSLILLSIPILLASMTAGAFPQSRVQGLHSTGRLPCWFPSRRAHTPPPPRHLMTPSLLLLSFHCPGNGAEMGSQWGSHHLHPPSMLLLLQPSYAPGQ